MTIATPSSSPPAATTNWSDGQLLAVTAESGSATAFEVVVRRHMSMVYGVCRRLLDNDSDGEDAAQAVFLVLWKRAGRLTRDGSVAAWLHRVARNICRNELRSRQARQRREREASMQRPTTSEATSDRSLRESLDEELNHLPEKYRTLLILFHLEGKSLEEVSSLTQTKAATVGTQLMRARQLLAQRLSRRGVVVTGMTLTPLLAAVSRASAAPPGFLEATVQAAQAFSGAKSAAGAVAAKSSSAAETVLRSMALAPLKIAAASAALVIAVAGGLYLAPFSQPAPGPRNVEAVPLVSAPVVQFDDGLYAGRIEVIASDTMVQFSAAFFDDGRRVAIARAWSGGAGDLRVWELPSGRLLQQRFEPTGIRALAASYDGSLLAYGCGYRDIRIVSSDTLEPVRTLTGHALGPVSLAFSPDDRWLASGGWDWTLRIWDVGSGKSLAVAEAAGQLVGAVRFDSTGQRLVSGPTANRIECWDWDGTGLKRTSQQAADTPPAAASTISASEQRLVTTSRDGSQLTVFRSDDGTVLKTWTIPPKDGRAHQLAASLDAQTVLTATDHGVLHVWNLDRESPAARWHAHDHRVVGLAVDSAGGRAVSIGAEGGIHVWNVATGREVCTLVEPNKPIQDGEPAVGAVSLGGRFQLLERRPGEWRLYETRTGRLIAEPILPREAAHAVAITSDGQRLITAGRSGQLHVREIASSTPSSTHAVHSRPVTTLALLPDELRCLSGDGSGVVCITDLGSGRVLFRRQLHHGPVRCCGVLRDGHWLITAGEDGTIQLVNPGELEHSVELGRHSAAIMSLAVGSSQTLLATADAAGNISLWRIPAPGASPTGRPERRLSRRDWWPEETGPAAPTTSFPSQPPITALAFSPLERTLLIGTSDSAIVHLDIATNQSPRRVPTLGPVTSLTFPDDDTALLVSLAGGQLYRERASLESVQTLSGHTGNVRFISYAEGGGRMVSGGEDKTIRLWDLKTGQQLASAESGHGAVVTGAVSPDGGSLVTAGYGAGIYFWDARSLTRTGARHDHSARVSALTYAPDGRWLASGSWDTSVRLWATTTQKVVRRFHGLTKGVADVQFSPDGRLLAACSGNWTEWFRNGEVCVWEVDTGRLVFRQEGARGGYGSLQFTPDGQRLYATATEIVQVWETATGKLLESHVDDGATTECAFLDPQTLIVRGHPHEIRVRDIPSGLLRCSFSPRAALLFDLATSPDETQFAAATFDGRIVLWKLPHD